MINDEKTENEVKLKRWTDMAADVAGYVIGAAILFVMFAYSGSLY